MIQCIMQFSNDILENIQKIDIILYHIHYSISRIEYSSGLLARSKVPAPAHTRTRRRMTVIDTTHYFTHIPLYYDMYDMM